MRDREPRLRAILLGASNLRTSFPFVLDRLRQRAGGPVEVLAACGHGRSYGMRSRFLGVRSLPGIAGCGLWRELGRRPPLPALALISDAGNDLVYGAGVEQVAGWVESCLDRLVGPGTEMAMTLLPLARLEKLSPWQVWLAVSLLFPGRSAPWPALLERARELDERLRRMGRERGARLIEPEGEWYGLDPIHPRCGRQREIWTRAIPLESAVPPPAGRPRIPLFGAEETRLTGVSLHRSQPAVRLQDGTSVSFY